MLDAVRAAARRLREAVRELELIAVEDRPQRGGVHLVDIVSNAALEASGEAEQLVLALPEGGSPEVVARGQAHLVALGAVLVRELAAPERLADLASLDDHHGREARAWAGEVTRCVHACQCALWTDMQPALVAYWQEQAAAGDRHRPSRRKDNSDA